MSKLSSREKVMLYVLVLVVVLAVGTRFIVQPLLNTTANVQDEIDEQSMLQMDMMEANTSVDMLKTQITDTEDEISLLQSDLYPGLINDSFDELVTGLMLKHHLVPVSLKMSDLAITDILSYGDQALTDGEANNQQSNGDGDVQTDNKYPQLYTNTVEIIAEGSRSNIISFIDEVNNMPALKAVAVEIYSDESVGKDLLSATLIAYSGV